LQRSLLLFENSLKTDATRIKYLYYIDQFKDFYKLKDYDSMISIPVEKLQIMVEDYVMMLKKKINPNSVNTYMAGIQAFFETNDIDLRWKKIRRLYPAKIKKTGAKMWTTEEIDLMLKNTRDYRQKALIHFIAASGVRRGAIPNLKIKHLKKLEKCYAVTVYEGNLEEYTTFLHHEASFWLDKYLEQRRNDGEYIDGNSPVFRKSYQLGIQKVIPMNDELVLRSIWHVINKSGLRAGQEKRSGRYETQTDHGFRKRWNTIMKTTPGINIILVEKMMGHSTPTSPQDETYLVDTVDMLFEEYKKGIPNLIIDKSERKQAELEIERSKNDEYQKRLNEIDSLKKDMQSVKNTLLEQFKQSDHKNNS
jgi:integrase